MGKRGPKADPETVRSRYVRVRLHDEEHIQLMDKAEAADMSMSEFVRDRCKLRYKKPKRRSVPG
jgi:hypothetical protein